MAAVCGDGLRGQRVIYMKRSNYIGSSEKLRKKCLPFENRVSDAVKQQQDLFISARFSESKNITH